MPGIPSKDDLNLGLKSMALKSDVLMKLQAIMEARLLKIEGELKSETNDLDREKLIREQKKLKIDRDKAKHATDLYSMFLPLHYSHVESKRSAVFSQQTKINQLKSLKTASPLEKGILKSLENEHPQDVKDFESKFSSYQTRCLLMEKILSQALSLPSGLLPDDLRLSWVKSEVAKDFFMFDSDLSFTIVEKSQAMALRLAALDAAGTEEGIALSKALDDYSSTDSKDSLVIRNEALNVAKNKAFLYVIKKMTLDTQLDPAYEFELLSRMQNNHSASGIGLMMKSNALKALLMETNERLKNIDADIANGAGSEERLPVLKAEKLKKETLLELISSTVVEFQKAETFAKVSNSSSLLKPINDKAKLEKDLEIAKKEFSESVAYCEGLYQKCIKAEEKISDKVALAQLKEKLQSDIHQKDFMLTPSQKARCMIIRLNVVGAGKSSEYKKLSAALSSYAEDPTSKGRAKELADLCNQAVPIIIKQATLTNNWSTYNTEYQNNINLNESIAEKYKEQYLLEYMKKRYSIKEREFLTEVATYAVKPVKGEVNNNLAILELKNHNKLIIQSALDSINLHQVNDILENYNDKILIHSLITLTTQGAATFLEHQSKLAAAARKIEQAKKAYSKFNQDTLNTKDIIEIQQITSLHRSLLDAVLEYQEIAAITERAYNQNPPHLLIEMLKKNKEPIQQAIADSKTEYKGDISAYDHYLLMEMNLKIKSDFSELKAPLEMGEYLNTRLHLLPFKTNVNSDALSEIKKDKIFSPEDYAELFESKNESPIELFIAKKLRAIEDDKMQAQAEPLKKSSIFNVFSRSPKKANAANIKAKMDAIDARYRDLFKKLSKVVFKITYRTTLSMVKKNLDIPDLVKGVSTPVIVSVPKTKLPELKAVESKIPVEVVPPSAASVDLKFDPPSEVKEKKSTPSLQDSPSELDLDDDTYEELELEDLADFSFSSRNRAEPLKSTSSVGEVSKDESYAQPIAPLPTRSIKPTIEDDDLDLPPLELLNPHAPRASHKRDKKAPYEMTPDEEDDLPDLELQDEITPFTRHFKTPPKHDTLASTRAPASQQQSTNAGSTAQTSNVDLNAIKQIIRNLDRSYPSSKTFITPAFSDIFLKRWEEDKKIVISFMEKIQTISPAVYKDAEGVLAKIELKISSAKEIQKPTAEQSQSIHNKFRGK